MTFSFFLGLGAGFTGVGAWFLSKSFFKVEEGHLAVLTSFGAALVEALPGKSIRKFPAGLHFKLPWQKVHEFSVMERVIDLSGNEGGRQAMAHDGTILRLDSKLRFRLLPEHLYSYLFELKNPEEHIKEVFTCLLRNEIANFPNSIEKEKIIIPQIAGDPEFEIGSYAEIRRERKLLNQSIEEFCKKRIGQHYGVRFEAVDLTDILPPEELSQALNSVAQASAEAETQYARAEGDSRQKTASARKGIEIAAARAAAAETEILELAGALDELSKKGTLNAYVARRRTEIMSESKMTFLKR